MRIAKDIMKAIIFVILATLLLSGCLVKQTVTNSQGVVIQDKYIIKRPVKEALKNMEVE
jgi:uncharacterized protein YcfL